jgi:predicted small secreted protein
MTIIICLYGNFLCFINYLVEILEKPKFIGGVYMKNTIKVFGNLNRARSAMVPLLIIAVVAIIGFSMAACNNDEEGGKDALDGTTWNASMAGEDGTATYVLKFNSPNFTMSMSMGGQTQSMAGTYSISGNNVTLTSPSLGAGLLGTLSGNTLSFTSGPTFTKK